MAAKVEKTNNRSKRGRPVLLNDVLKQTIILYKSSNPDWPAGKILDSIKANYYNKVRKIHPDWPDNKIREQSAFPGVNRIQRYLKEISPLDNQQSPLEEKWHLGTVQDYPITPEAVKKIFELKARGKGYVSIRIARWISRLCALPLPLDALYLSAMEYSTAEEIAEISHTKLNTLNMDMMLLEHMKNTEVHGNGSKKSEVIPVKNQAEPVKTDVTTDKAGTIAEKAAVIHEKNDVKPVKNDIAPVKNVTKTIAKDVRPEKVDIVPDNKVVEPEKKDVPTDNKKVITPEDEEPAIDINQKESLKQWHLPDTSKRQSSINEFLKFVERQKGKEL